MGEQKHIEVGQIVWLTGGFRTSEPKECVISKIGNKYFYVLDGYKNEYKISLDKFTEHTDSNYRRKCWLSIEEYDADRLLNLKRQKINIQLRDKLTDEQVSAIYDILNP